MNSSTLDPEKTMQLFLHPTYLVLLVSCDTLGHLSNKAPHYTETLYVIKVSAELKIQILFNTARDHFCSSHRVNTCKHPVSDSEAPTSRSFRLPFSNQSHVMKVKGDDSPIRLFLYTKKKLTDKTPNTMNNLISWF